MLQLVQEVSSTMKTSQEEIANIDPPSGNGVFNRAVIPF
jgi:hypothetical protein